MSFLLVIVVLSFQLSHVQTANESEWENLLRRYREIKTTETPPKRLLSEDVTLEDEASKRLFDLPEDEGISGIDEEWNRLVNGTSEWDVGQLKDGLDGEQSVRGSSLAFVFDSTGSMSDELRQVKAGAMKILAALRDHPDAPIFNYIWVPFNDPAIGPVTVTTDPKLFQKRMEDVSVSGGGDCPENSIGAIKKALEASLPNSYIYVFTDAFAKDHRLQNEVLSLVQRKQAQVVFILTGECTDGNEAQYKVYERIAETSSGQIYHLNRHEVNEVLKYVKVALQPHIVSLLSVNKPAPDKLTPDKVEVVIDESLKQFTVSVSGANATINVTDPKGINIDGPPKLEKVLNLTNIKIVNVNEPDPGSWNVYINSDSNYTVRSTGLSKVNFNHGFSTVETINLKETNYRPLKGARSFLLIQTSDAEKVYNITNVDFVSLNGDVIQRLGLIPVPGVPGLYKAGSFIPPTEFFYLGITGFGQDGLPFKRITSTAVSGQLPEKPIITMKSKSIGRYNQSNSFKCYIESVVPFTVRWYKDGVFIGEEKNCSETCEVVLNIEKMTSQSEGIYTCSAKNVAGADSRSITLTVIDEPPVVRMNSSVVSVLGDDVYLDCLVESNVPYIVKWTQFTARNQHSGVLHPVSTGIHLPNNTLHIPSVKPEDEGWYVCNVANKHGETKSRVLLIVKEPLTVTIEPSTLFFIEGSSARLTCSATGKPKPRLEWLKDQQRIKDEDPSIFIEEVNGNLNLMIDYLEKRNAGMYMCNAVNQEESASATAELIYTEKPTIKAKENNLMVKSGSQVVIQCLATGYPEPSITWYKGENEISSDDPRFVVDGGILKILSAESGDAGEYSCVGRNDLGVDVDYIGLIVGSSPSFLQKPRDKKIQINHNGTIACSALGVPPAEIKWRRLNGKEIDSSRMFILSSGALKVTRMKVEDAGLYECIAENVFGSIHSSVSIKVTGVEKPTQDKTIDLRNIEAHSGNDLSIPCGLILGNPPGVVKWYKDTIELQPNSLTTIDSSGTLILRNVTSENRGNYVCEVHNAAGNSSRSFDILITETPKIIQTNKTELKGVVNGEIIIPCPVEGFPPPTITWTKNGHPLPMSSTIFQDENGSLIIRNLSEENTGVYVCTAINAVGSTSKATSIQVHVPPVFPNDTQDTPINVVEGHVVVLNCNVTAVPEPTIQWFRNEEPILQNGDQPKILRFVANMDDTGLYKCIVTNEAGFTTKEFNVTILVPPKILGRNNEESIKAKAGMPITLMCNVFGFPPPTILWQRNGMYLTQNTSEITISPGGMLTIQNVTKESAGAYTCDAENLGGITQRIYYLQVNYPPKILEDNTTKLITLKEGEDYSLTCLVEGNPKPNIVWRKNGIPIHGKLQDLLILEDNTLLFLQVTKETTGTYKCEAISSEGSTSIEHEIKVLIPPSLFSDYYPTRLEVNEGDSISLTCPTSSSDPPPTIQWIKDGEELFLYERSDEAQMKLTFDQKTLTITEAHPSDRGNYSCIATNPAGRTDAKFLVDVLMTPHFEEFNHIAHRTILTGGDIVLNCSVTGNPQPVVTWRKEQTPITPHNTPGVHVSLDKQHLMIFNGRVHHTGTYVCLASNKVNAKEREFYITVLEPPQIDGPLQQSVEILKGENVTLECHGSGVPQPTYTWMKEDGTKKRLNNTEDHLTIINATCRDSGTYLCDVTNTAGTRTKHIELNVLEPPQVENEGTTDEVVGILGGNVTMKCKTTGEPTPEITWLHNGHIIQKRSTKPNSWKVSEDGYASLSLTNIQEQNKGSYTLLAANKAGLVQKNFYVRILVPPRLMDDHPGIKMYKVVQPFPIVLNCPVVGEPLPWISWFFGHVNGESINSNNIISLNGNELSITKSNYNNSGVYVCLAENPAGSVTYTFNVTVIGPPRVEGNEEETYTLPVGEMLVLWCNTTGDESITRNWFHYSELLYNSTNTPILDTGRILMIPDTQPKHSGVYRCISTNIAGSTEITYKVDIHEPPGVGHLTAEDYKLVQLHHPFSLYCYFTGYPPPQVSWYKDGRPFESKNSVLMGDSFLTFPSSKPEDGGEYKCIAENSVGVWEKTFRVDIIVLGEWTVWSPWSECSVSCGLGEQKRRRSCHTGVSTYSKVRIDRSKCVGNDVERRKCFRECQSIETWSTWTPCSTTCGNGIRRRYKICNNTECERKETEEEMCKEKECPIYGQWSDWSSWSECSDPCGGGIMQRVRKCNSPSPQYGGDECPGWGSELKICNRHKCLDPGKWLPWSEWSPCIGTCGKSHKRRQRFCKKSNRGDTCKGENIQIKKCHLENCDKLFPSSANLRLKGKLNGNPIDNQIDVTIDNDRQISANLKRKDKLLPYAPFILSPLSWNTAKEEDEADNGYSLTNGNFFSQSEIQFATGEELKMKHKGDGVNQNGTLTVEIEVLGEVPIPEPHSYVYLKPIEQDYMQTSSNTLFSSTQHNVSVEGRDVPYIWNSSIRYDGTRGTMPFLVEKLSIREIPHDYNPESQNVSFTVASTIGKKFDKNRCPPGFIHDPNYMHCQDINECEMLDKLCPNTETCVNTFGSYKCVCATGYRPYDDSCVDIDECLNRDVSCSHFCQNTQGSYTCSCPFGFYLSNDFHTCLEMFPTQDDGLESEEVEIVERNSSVFEYGDYDRLLEYKESQGMECPTGYFYLNNQCRDYNECEDKPNICDEDELCINFPGSYKCLNIPCPTGYERLQPNKNCIKRCSSERKCHKGATISESTIFKTVTFYPKNPALVYFYDIGEPQCNVSYTRYRVAEGNGLFQVRVTKGRGALYPVRRLNRNTLYRVKIEAFSYDANDTLLYFTEFILFVVVSN